MKRAPRDSSSIGGGDSTGRGKKKLCRATSNGHGGDEPGGNVVRSVDRTFPWDRPCQTTEQNSLVAMPTTNGMVVYFCADHAAFWSDVFSFIPADEIITMRSVTVKYNEKVDAADKVWRLKKEGQLVNVENGNSSCLRLLKVSKAVIEKATILNDDEYQKEMKK